jgi:hypothetical protein
MLSPSEVDRIKNSYIPTHIPKEQIMTGQISSMPFDYLVEEGAISYGIGDWAVMKENVDV